MLMLYLFWILFFCHHVNQIKGLMSPCNCVYSDKEVAVRFTLSIQNPNKSYKRPLILHHPAPDGTRLREEEKAIAKYVL